MDGTLSVMLIGTGDYAKKIETLFSKAGFKVSTLDKSAKTSLSADLVIEAVPGDAGQKAKALGSAASPGTIVATTIAGGVTQVAALAGSPAKTVGLHFIFNPFEDKCLVEMVNGLETSAETLETCRHTLEKTGATVVTAEDVSGCIVDRVMASVINEAAFMYETKLASMDDINRIPKLCLNWPLGPFEFADLIGIDNVVSTLESASHDGQQYLPCRLLKQMVAAGKLGKKAGKGFYDYAGKL